MKPFFFIAALLCSFSITTIAQRVNRAFNWYDKPDTRNDSINLIRLKIKSITVVTTIPLFEGIGKKMRDTVIDKRIARRFDSTGRIIPDIQDKFELTYKHSFKYNKKGQLIEDEVTEEHNHIHNICHYKYNSIGDITEMNATILGSFYEGDITSVLYKYDKENLLIKAEYYDKLHDPKGYYETVTYYYEFYK